MVREHFTHQIEEIKRKVLRMGSMVENIINIAVTALKEQNAEMAKKVYIEDDEIDAMELEIEEQCMRLLALQQPIAKDLRTITTALKIITDLERMGDHAVNIAKIVIEIGKEPLIKPLVDIPKMADMAQEMVRLSLDAFVKEDKALARKVAEMDEEVDKIYEEILKDVLELITAKKDTIRQGTKLLFIGRYLERIADHTTNVCERTIYMITGKLEEIN
ncbi:phosphate signaling complex protein PhoU [Fonticella tunisiensis]|uniref:Phosphate-specific transport system accessory protein PhoU n=1 Tax=Fonticella tunisiensis TaxID=1096341 RepID=A0A4R7KB80_9CLOT|nr:phosphate signaling complex protein PhoU [Fonticella tunisiensis]TDT51238.1 PhoU-like phosphate uptake regulator [Fonticella tunisiensis]